jgi:hypothetical protein
MGRSDEPHRDGASGNGRQSWLSCTTPINVNERHRAKWALGVLGALPIVLGGCVAQIKETRLYGAARPALGARSERFVERRAGIDGAAECRDVIVTDPMVREVEIRRSFADGAQERDLAIVALLVEGIGLISYGQDQAQCPPSGGACSDPTKAEYVLLGLAAIPIVFLAYNAVAVQDSRIIEGVAPEASPGPWRACSK